MPELKEVFDMVTKQTEPDLGSWNEQEHRQRRSARNRRVGAFAIVAVLGTVAAIVALRLNADERDRTGTQPAPVAPDSDYTIDLETGAIAPLPRSITQAADEIGGFAVSPAGDVIAFNGSDRDGMSQVFVANLDGTGVRQFTDRADGANFPTWSADGSRIAYASPAGGGTQNVFVHDLATAEATKVTFEEDGFLGTYGFSPDGTSLIYTLDPQDGTGGRIRIVRLEDGRNTLLHDPKQGDAGDGVLSPDGRHLSYGGSADSDDISGSANRWLADPNGEDARLLVEGNFPSATWSPDSTRLAYWSFPEQEVFVIDIASGESRPVTDGAWPVWLDDHTLIVEPDSGL